MKIAIDGRWIFREISGIGAYTRELIRQLALLDAQDEVVIFFDNAAVRERTWREAGLADAPNFTARDLPYGVFSIGSQWKLPSLLRRLGVDVFHSTNYMIPLAAFPRHRSGPVKCVATVHDVIPLIFRDQVARSRKARVFPLYRRLMREVGARSDALITDSRASRADILKCLRIPRESEHKVHVVYCGVGEGFAPGAARAGDGTPGTRTRNLLYVGRADPYKNLVTLVRAFKAVREQCPAEVTLTVAGTPDPRYPEAGQLARELGVDSAIRWTGYLSDEDLVSVYRGADLLAHPSRYEGFGLQVVEAMACGVPVICSNTGALPEVAGDAAVLLSPDDVEKWAERISEVLTHPDLARTLSERGREQARKFSWARTATDTLRVYREVANQ